MTRKPADPAPCQVDEPVLASFFHELRTPLNVIVGWAQLLRSADQDSETVAAGLAAIERNAMAQVRIIDQAVDAFHLVAGNSQLEVRRVAIQFVVEAAVDAARRELVEKGLRLETELGSQDAFVDGDSDRLRQVVRHLLANATKFTPAGGVVRLRLDRWSEGIAITVSDTGRGIKAASLPTVFDRICPGGRAQAEPGDGPGMGLTLVRRLVELHHGTVVVTSPGEGLGATVVVHLPLAPS